MASWTERRSCRYRRYFAAIPTASLNGSGVCCQVVQSAKRARSRWSLPSITAQRPASLVRVCRPHGNSHDRGGHSQQRGDRRASSSVVAPQRHRLRQVPGHVRRGRGCAARRGSPWGAACAPTPPRWRATPRWTTTRPFTWHKSDEEILHRVSLDTPGVPPTHCHGSPWITWLHTQTPAQRWSRLVDADRRGVHAEDRQRGSAQVTAYPLISCRPAWQADRHLTTDPGGVAPASRRCRTDSTRKSWASAGNAQELTMSMAALW